MKRICTVLVCAMFASASVCAAEWPEWAENAFSWAEQSEISDDFLQEPETIVTRGMAAQLMYEAAGRPSSAYELPFSDVPDEYSDAVAWAAENSYIEGVGDGLFVTDNAVTRQEFAAMLYRQAGSPVVSAYDMRGYTDTDTVSEWARSAVCWSVQTGIMTGRSETQLVPCDTITTAEALMMLQRDRSLPDTSGIKTDLEALTVSERSIGSEGEAAAAGYLQERFAGMGYTVTRQPYTDEMNRTGTNVIAVKGASGPDADIMILSAHHDSVPTAYGANDNASGVAALLYAAEALKDIDTDTEIRFISFTDEENGKNGSRAYIESLSSEEKDRMIGDIQFDMLGGLGAGDAVVCTADGEANWVSDLLQDTQPGLVRKAESASDHASFQLAGIPSVLLMQDGQGYLYHSAADCADRINVYSVARAAETAVSAVKEIISAETPSYRDIAEEQGDGYTYRQTRQNVIYFGSSLKDTEAYIGASGELFDHNEVTGNGWTDMYDTYRYYMRWFDGDTPMATYYRYRNGFLERIEIRPEETGYSSEQVRELIEAMYGVPSSEKDGAVSWIDEIYSKYISFSEDESGCFVTVSNYSVGITNVLASYPVVNGQASVSDLEDARVWDYLCSILPESARQKITEFDLFTDGCSNVLAYTSPVKENDITDNTRFSMSIDYYDVYDENGMPRDWSKLTYTIIHEYGHVLLEDETQIDLTKGTGTHDPNTFIDGSFRMDFYEKFWKTLGDSAVDDYESNPTHYVSRYGANYFHEDIADTFAVFVLGG